MLASRQKPSYLQGTNPRINFVFKRVKKATEKRTGRTGGHEGKDDGKERTSRRGGSKEGDALISQVMKIGNRRK